MSLKIYESYPGSMVEFYDLVRGILLSNDVQTHLMQKIGAPGDFPSRKSTADAFEMLVGASYTEHRNNETEEEFQTWFDDTFTPLMEAADAAHSAYEQWKGAKVTPLKKVKRKKREKVLNAVRICRQRQDIFKRRREVARPKIRVEQDAGLLFSPAAQQSPDPLSTDDITQMRSLARNLRLHASTLEGNMWFINAKSPVREVADELSTYKSRAHNIFADIEACIWPQKVPLFPPLPKLLPPSGYFVSRQNVVMMQTLIKDIRRDFSLLGIFFNRDTPYRDTVDRQNTRIENDISRLQGHLSQIANN
ncbi:hypothetical protein FB45DRAFT_913547 [Roridomyces roridus]|uniref:Uncharacterized protein n=1 Tax=Roridomyces roridus TaxID=1738132 RepID=A0AAD7BY95_9AGAR|nr:hypothetical protein FB45DRAFT_913547 [Roridomyces roridus]